MKSTKILLAIAALALAALACGINITFPDVRIDTGPTQVQDIDVAYPAGGETAQLQLDFGAGVLVIEPGVQDALVRGTATFNVDGLAPEINIRGNLVEIGQDDFDVNLSHIPEINDYENEWELALGREPIDLNINAGAYEGNIELGGLAIENLTIFDGAADVTVSFSEPNRIEMDTLRYSTGASDVTLEGLANANFSNMEFDAGAGNYTLDFSGVLQQDARVDINSGLSNLVIVVPEGVQARVVLTGALTNVNTRGEWRSSGSEYTLSGDGPTLTIYIEIGAGNLTLEN